MTLFLKSAFKHGVTAEDSLFVMRFPLHQEILRDEPLKIVYLGISPRGIPLEVVATDTLRGTAIIHSMRMRGAYKKLLKNNRRGKNENTSKS
jgi:hypothetical protein